MKRTFSMYLTFILVVMGISTAILPQSAMGQSKGWCEEKTLIRASTIADRVSLPAIATDGDDVYITYRQKNIKVITSNDRGKTWNEPIVLGPELPICGTPAIAKFENKTFVIWPARVDIGEISPFQIFVSESTDKGVTWSPPKKLTQSRDDALTPRVLVNGDKILLLWLETPLAETLGSISVDKGFDFSASTPDELFKLSTDQSGGLAGKQKRLRSNILVSTLDPKTGELSDPMKVDEIFSEWLPHVFTLYGPLNGNFYVTLNQNTDIKSYESKDGGMKWTPYFQDREHFNPQVIPDLKIMDNKRVSTWIRRAPYSSIPVNFNDGVSTRSIQLSPSHYVRSLPRFDFSDNDYHVVWEAGQEGDSWLTYIRTDDVPPTSTVIEPQSPDVTGTEITFIWEGDDNISSPDRLKYSFSYAGGESWSPVQDETSTTLKTPKDGEYTFRVRAEDVAGNIQDKLAEFQFNTFKSAPDTEITATPSPNEELNTRQVEISFTGMDNNDAPSDLEFSVRADDGEWGDFEKKTSHTFDNLANGKHQFEVRARDSRGNVDASPVSCAVTIKVGLELVLEGVPETTTNEEEISFSWTGKDDKGQTVELTYYYQLDKEAPKKLETNSVSLQSLEEGRHEFVVWGQDESGDKTPEVSYRWLIDRTPPETIASFTKEFVNKFPKIDLRSEDPNNSVQPSKFEYRIGDSEWIPFSNPGATWLFDRTLSYFSIGYSVEVRSIDSAGNIDPTPATVDLRIFNTRPVYFYSVVTVLAILLLFILKVLLGKLRSRRPVSSASMSSDGMDEGDSAESKFKNLMDSDDSEDYSFDYGDDDKDDDDDEYKF